MAGPTILPEKITNPFQLMAAWFAVLVLLVTILLTTAINITNPPWASGYLIIFTSILIIFVLGCVLTMLTVFRPHLQDGKEYAQWLKDKNTYSIVPSSQSIVSTEISKAIIHTPTKVLINKKRTTINVSYLPGSDVLIRNLAEAGFEADIYEPWPRDPSKSPEFHESIWVGCWVSADDAIESIRIAVSQWPHLKYMHLSNDGGDPPEEIHMQMYFGGSSLTAKDYGLSPWTTDELLKIDQNLSQIDFHQKIREKYKRIRGLKSLSRTSTD